MLVLSFVNWKQLYFIMISSVSTDSRFSSFHCVQTIEVQRRFSRFAELQSDLTSTVALNVHYDGTVAGFVISHGANCSCFRVSAANRLTAFNVERVYVDYYINDYIIHVRTAVCQISSKCVLFVSCYFIAVCVVLLCTK